MIYRIKKGSKYHNKLLSFISQTDKWEFVLRDINNILEYDAKDGGIYPLLNNMKSLKTNIEKVPIDKKRYYDKNGWLLPNNKYYDKWKKVVDKINLKSLDLTCLKNEFILDIFENPEMNLNIGTFDLYIKCKSIRKIENSEQEKKEKELLDKYFELTSLEDFN